MLFLVFGYFYESFLEIRKVKPVVVAIEKIKDNKTSEPDVVISDNKQ